MNEHAMPLRDALDEFSDPGEFSEADEFSDAGDSDDGSCAPAVELCARQRTTSDLRAQYQALRGKFTAASSQPRHPRKTSSAAHV